MDDAGHGAVCTRQRGAIVAGVAVLQRRVASIKGGLANMDVLVTLGTVSIYAYSAFMMFYHQSLGHDGMAHVYFEVRRDDYRLCEPRQILGAAG